MPDSRFFRALGPLTLADLAGRIGAVLSVPSAGGLIMSGVAPLKRAEAGEIAFLQDKRYVADLATTAASAVLVYENDREKVPAGCVALVTREPQAAYARASILLHSADLHEPGAPAIHPDSEREADEKFGPVIVGPGVVIGQKARIGAGTQIGPNTVIGPGVCIGRNCRIGANVTIGFALIGDRVQIYSGAVIGAEGFGVAGSALGAIDIPQLGRVIIQDDVTIGANCCIDRGAWDDTVIGERTKLDNMVQIAHNVQLGRNCLVAAQTGISGSTLVGDGVMFGGQAGIVDHVKIGAGARIAAAAGVTKDVPAGATWSGYPARPVLRAMRESAWVSRNAELSAKGRKKGGDER